MTGQIVPATTGAYVFKAKGNGAMQVFVAGVTDTAPGTRVVVSNSTPVNGSNGLDIQAASTGKMRLVAGQTYTVTVTYSYESMWVPYLGGAWGAQFSYAALQPAQDLSKYDAVIVSGGRGLEYDGEGRDQPFELPEYQSELIANVAAVNPHSVAVLYTAQGVDMAAFNDGVAGLLYAWYPGQNGGEALANVLLGAVAPSGKLPSSIGHTFAEDPASQDFPLPLNYSSNTNINYKEGLYFDYRGYDRNATPPLYSFGFGLSYTQFSYSNLHLSTGTVAGQPVVDVVFDVANSGKVKGAEVAEVYVGEPNAPVARPLKELKGFARASIAASASAHYVVQLPAGV